MRQRPRCSTVHAGKGVQSPHKWSKYWDIMLDAKDIFGPQKFGAHIIVGMGETE